MSSGTTAASTAEADALLAEVSAAAGLTDFGPDDFRPGLALLLETHRRAPLTDIGRMTKDAWLRRLLTNRLEIAEVLRRDPTILDRRINAPVIITGLARSGTTVLHRILAEVPGQRVMLRYEALYPAPPRNPAPREDPRLLAARAEEEMLASTGTLAALDVMHVIRADLPEEDYLLLETAMRFASTGEQCWQPFREWQETADQGPAYDYYLTMLQVLDSHRSGTRWLLKNPSHLANVERLIERFPDVRIVWTHRDPIAATASLCSLLWFAMPMLADVDKYEFCAALADGCVLSVARAMDVRDRLGDEHFVDVDYRELAADPAKTAEWVARAVGLPISDETAAALRRYSDENRQDRHGIHVYDLTEFGLDRADLRERFRPYTERFHIDS